MSGLPSYLKPDEKEGETYIESFHDDDFEEIKAILELEKIYLSRIRNKIKVRGGDKEKRHEMIIQYLLKPEETKREEYFDDDEEEDYVLAKMANKGKKKEPKAPTSVVPPPAIPVVVPEKETKILTDEEPVKSMGKEYSKGEHKPQYSNKDNQGKQTNYQNRNYTKDGGNFNQNRSYSDRPKQNNERNNGPYIDRKNYHTPQGGNYPNQSRDYNSSDKYINEPTKRIDQANDSSNEARTTGYQKNYRNDERGFGNNQYKRNFSQDSKPPNDEKADYVQKNSDDFQKRRNNSQNPKPQIDGMALVNKYSGTNQNRRNNPQDQKQPNGMDYVDKYNRKNEEGNANDQNNQQRRHYIRNSRPPNQSGNAPGTDRPYQNYPRRNREYTNKNYEKPINTNSSDLPSPNPNYGSPKQSVPRATKPENSPKPIPKQFQPYIPAIIPSITPVNIPVIETTDEMRRALKFIFPSINNDDSQEKIWELSIVKKENVKEKVEQTNTEPSIVINAPYTLATYLIEYLSVNLESKYVGQYYKFPYTATLPFVLRLPIEIPISVLCDSEDRSKVKINIYKYSNIPSEKVESQIKKALQAIYQYGIQEFVISKVEEDIPSSFVSNLEKEIDSPIIVCPTESFVEDGAKYYIIKYQVLKNNWNPEKERSVNNQFQRLYDQYALRFCSQCYSLYIENDGTKCVENYHRGKRIPLEDDPDEMEVIEFDEETNEPITIWNYTCCGEVCVEDHDGCAQRTNPSHKHDKYFSEFHINDLPTLNSK